jgi:sugar phosphate isomerase/epimerase
MCAANFLEEVDTSRPENLEQAKRVIERCSELGVHHILWSARDSRVVTHEESTDSWQWGASLWLTMGEKIVSGEWLPSSSSATLPPSLASLLEFAESKNVSLCPYVYPSLGMGRGLNGSEAWLFGSSEGMHCEKMPCSKGVSSRLANRDYQDFLIEELLAFIKKTGSMGTHLPCLPAYLTYLAGCLPTHSP